MYLGAGSFMYLLVTSRIYDLVKLVSRFKRGIYWYSFLGFTFYSLTLSSERMFTDGFLAFLFLFLLIY